jgi:hypothetical protein
LDTRAGVGAAKVAVAAGGTVHLQVAGRGGVPASGVSAVVLNVTVTAPTSAGFITVYGDGTARPTASNLNFVKGQTVPNLVIAPVGANGKVDLYNGSAGTVQLIGDVSGYYRSGASTLKWSTPIPIDPLQAGLKPVSCPSASFCAAVDANGNVLTFNGTSWSAPKVIDPSGVLTSVSCPSASFCAAVAEAGQVSTFNGASWSAPELVNPNGFLLSVSCPSVSFCVAVGGLSAVEFNGSTWSTPQIIDSSPDNTVGLRSVSCASSSFCAAVDGTYNGGFGNVVTFNGSGWSQPARIDPNDGLFSVSCRC